MVQYGGVPESSAEHQVGAGVVAQSLSALDSLRAQGVENILFEVCSTFYSTPDGNIRAGRRGTRRGAGSQAPVIVSAAFPATGRSVYQGHLFVGDRLLSERSLENHPLTPTTYPDVVL